LQGEVFCQYLHSTPFTHITGHGFVGGAANEALGGKFQDGFLSAAASAYAGWTVMRNSFVKSSIRSETVGRTAMAGIIGGTASALGGGKFANGAWTATFHHLLNAEQGAIRKTLRDGVYLMKRNGNGSDLFFDFFDESIQQAADFNERHIAEGKDSYIIHGHGSDVDGIYGGSTNGKQVWHGAKEVAKIVKDDPNFSGKTGVKLYACYTGSTANTASPFAKQLAAELGVPISAPNMYLNGAAYFNKSYTDWYLSEKPGAAAPSPNGKWNYFK
jgi:hypothetical protein